MLTLTLIVSVVEFNSNLFNAIFPYLHKYIENNSLPKTALIRSILYNTNY